MSGENISKVQRVLLALVSKSMFGTPFDPQELQNLSSEELNELYRESVYQAVPAVAFDGIDTPKEILGEKLYRRWLSTSRANILNTQRIWENHALVAKKLEEAGIPYTILKGCASAYCYKKKYLRTMGDVDFLVHKEDETAATEVFSSLGWEVDDHQENHIVLHKSERECVELCYEPPGIPYDTEAENIVKSIMSNTVDSSASVVFESFKLNIPDKLHQFFVLILHTFHHLAFEGIGLRHLCDIAAFSSEYVTREMWDNELKPLLKKCGLFKFASVLFVLCEKYLGVPSRKIEFDVDEALCNEILCDIFSGGNFGHKDKARLFSGTLIKSLSTKENGNRLVNILSYVKNIALIRFPIAKKHPVLLPAVMVATLVRYMFRRITGKHKNQAAISDKVSVTIKRQALLRRLELFVIERDIV